MSGRWGVLGLIVLVGCAANPSPPPARGTERAPCRPDRSCADGLICLSDRCVRPAGADCQLVAETLTTLELGNYAEVEERAAREKALRAQCEREHMSKDDGACILTATTKDDLVWCPKPLIVPTQIGGGGGSGGSAVAATPQALTAICEAYVRTMERFARCSKLPPETARQLRQQIPQLRAMYAQYSTPSTDASCKMANDATTQAMVQIGC